MIRQQLFLFILGAIALASSRSLAAEYRLPLMQHPPSIDGKITPAEWSGAVQVDGFAWQGALERRRVTGYVGATADHLYLAIRSQLPDQGDLVAEVRRSSENLVYDDAVEFWIDPEVGNQGGRRLQLLLNPLGYHWYKLHPYGGAKDDPSWQGDWAIATTRHDGFWDCEVAIPIASIAPGRTAQDGAWGINLCRDWKQDWAWSSLGGDQYNPTDRFVFTRDPAPVVRLLQEGDPFVGDVHTRLSLSNPSTAPLSLTAQLSLDRDVMPTAKSGDTITLQPGETRDVALQVSDTQTKRYTETAQVTSPDGKTTYFSRKVAWSSAGPSKWTVQKKEIPPLDFRFAYYPYSNRMRILADVSNLPHGAVLQDLTATIRKPGGAVVKIIRFNQFRDGRQEQDFELPPLNGDYEIAMKAVGPNVPTQEVVKPFQRHVFPWEHNSLGRSHTVYAPFTPIKLVGKRLSTVLREHQLGDSGLWDQVTARETPLLAAPMRWDSVVDGAPAPITAGRLQFDHVAGDQVTAHTSISAGALRANVRCTWDYDGTMRTDLSLLPSAGKKINALTLVIPMRGDQATYYHAMGDGIRNTLYGKLPTGDGVIWTSKTVQANDIPKNFCTYLYAGTPVRGLCWFAENDSGWSWDHATPNIELVRQNGQVEMRVHLVNQPMVVDAPRTITFGLLAAPVKPRLGVDWRQRFRRDNYSILGTDINWLALGDCGSVYPAGKDMYLWEMIARGNRERLTDADIQKVIDRGTPYFAPYGTDMVNTFKAHARYNLTSRYGTKMIFYYNRASYQDAEEFQTFKDEWDLDDFHTVGPGTSRSEIKIVPSDSYIDHALYWYGKSFDLGGNQGVYWDNWFFDPSYNTAMTPAYRKGDPNAAAGDAPIVPATGVWEMRELAKRTFQYMNERGMLPIIIPHMTSTAILPMLSFATLQYDWEWHYSEGDVQYRFPREYILMASDGELAGTWPVLLGDHGSQEDDPWTGRTFAAVAMLHELDCPYPAYTKTGQMQRALFAPVDEILKQPGVQAYRYWDDPPQPVVSGNPDLPTIVYSVKGKQAVFAVVSYAEQDTPTTLSIDPAALGFPNGYRVVDTETGQDLPVENNQVHFTLKKHDIRIAKIEAR